MIDHSDFGGEGSESSKSITCSDILITIRQFIKHLIK